MMDHDQLSLLRDQHPAWRLLASPSAPLVISFLYEVFVRPNRRVIDEAALVEALEDALFALRERLGPAAYPQSARDYLDDWAGPKKGWLRKFYKSGTDEVQFDLTPAAEKAIAWVISLGERPFVGTESRLLTLFNLLEQLSSGTESDPEKRLAELHAKRAQIDAEIARIQAGDIPLLDDTAVKDRFLQFQQLARELLFDFREVEHHFRQLDRKVRERIALWDGSKGALLDEILNERDAIAESDQGKSFRAFWEFLLSSRHQETFAARLEQVLDLPAVASLKPDLRLRRVHDDWLEAAEHTQRTLARLSQQLRRFLDDRAFLENRRVLELIRGIEAKALEMRGSMPTGVMMELEAIGADLHLPLERPLSQPTVRPALVEQVIETAPLEIDTAALFAQVTVDKTRLLDAVERLLRIRPQITLAELIEAEPLQQGLAELLAYLALAHHGELDTLQVRAVIDDRQQDSIRWEAVGADGLPVVRIARLPRLILTR